MKLRVRTLDDPPPPPIAWLVPGIIPAIGSITMAGQPASGKSLLASSLLVSTASGRPWLGLDVAGPAAALFMSAEAAASTERRIRATAAECEAAVPIAFATGDIDLLHERAVEAICAAIDETSSRFRMPVSLLVIDALSSAARGADEKSGKDMGLIMGALQSVVKAKGLAILLLAHTPKSGDDRRVRGHSGLLADVDTHLSVFGNGRERTLTIEKQRDGEPGRSVKFEILADGGKLDVASIGGRASGARRPARLTGDKAVALQALVDLGGTATRDAWRDAAVTMFGSRDKGALRTAWSTARKALLEGGYATENGDTVSISAALATVSLPSAADGRER